MAIKMRTNKTADAICCSCWNGRNKSIELFDICLGEQVVTLCDECVDQLFTKALKATVGVQGKLKTQQDIKVIQMRRTKAGGGKWMQ